MNTKGWIRLSREFFTSEVFFDLLEDEPFSNRLAWIWLIVHAAWKPTKWRDGLEMVQLERGQLLGGRAYLAEQWGWGEKRVRNYLDLLVREGMISLTKRGQRPPIITLCNYCKYQDNPYAEGQQRANEGPMKGQIYKKVKKVKKDSPLYPPTGEAKSKKGKSMAAKSPLPSDWELPGEWHDWAASDTPAMASMIGREADRFRDYWHANGGRKIDWFATWRNWWRKAVDDAATRRPRPVPGHMSYTPAAMRNGYTLPPDQLLKAPLWKKSQDPETYGADTPEFNSYVTELMANGETDEAARIQQRGWIKMYPTKSLGELLERRKAR